ncbi:Transmembrane protein 184A [Hondaea fermentalgiana]|uniref:Transmembrane protein 184A n=1 Tax=Hondaea fermentalgiana TaxID=2315210 RepID=A0A2R5H0F8_9STRA|nr:Transmembrane protein 184A [Hondaea fermentalgiana]|eukprot:GBG34241.1 Transmembrane protein 184A [Hondaea fermentalgiana]
MAKLKNTIAQTATTRLQVCWDTSLASSKAKFKHTMKMATVPKLNTLMASGVPTAVPTAATTLAPTGTPTLQPTGAPTLTAVAQNMGDFVDGEAALFIALASALLAIWISLYNIFRHLVNYNEPLLQKNIIRILFMVTFYAAFSLLSLLFPNAQIYLDSIRDVYEAFVVYCFLNLMLIYCGGENACLSVIMHDPGAISHVWPMNWCLPHIAMNARFLRICKQWTLQFVIIKPIMAILNLFIIGSDKVNKHAWDITQNIVYNVSYTAALYALVLFYKATHGHPGLKSQYPVLKFVSVKLVVFATYYQSFLVSVIPDIPEKTLDSFNSFLLCCEMVVFALMQFWAFHYAEFTLSAAGKRAHIASRHDSAFDSVGIDMPTRNGGGGNAGGGEANGAAGGSIGAGADRSGISDKDTAFNNARKVIDMQDVASDAYINFSHKYGEHVLLDTTGNSGGTSMMDDTDDEDHNVGVTGQSKGSRFGLGRIGNTMRSLATGGRAGGVGGDDDLEPVAVNPFAGAGGAETGPSAGMQGHEHTDAEQSAVDFRLPSFPTSPSTEGDTQGRGLDNPFEQDLRDPLRSKGGDTSMGFDAVEGSDDPFSSGEGAASQGWTADFSDPRPASAASKTKKKKKKKKQQEENTDDVSDQLQLT